MPKRFAELTFTPHVQAIQEAHGSRKAYARRMDAGGVRDPLGEDERAFIGSRDSFYMATVGETGWPYIQHRGGPPGFLKTIDAHTIGFADLTGNKQYISAGNLATENRTALFLMDYPSQTRLKILARARVVERAEDPALIERLAVPGYDPRVERGIVFDVEAFDWNCPQHITPRYTAAEIERLVTPLHERIASLERELAARAQGDEAGGRSGAG